MAALTGPVSKGARKCGRPRVWSPPKEPSPLGRERHTSPVEDLPIIQLLTLWFVVLIFLQTGSGGGGPLVTAIGIVAVLLLYAIPAIVLLDVVGRFTSDGEEGDGRRGSPDE